MKDEKNHNDQNCTDSHPTGHVRSLLLEKEKIQCDSSRDNSLLDSQTNSQPTSKSLEQFYDEYRKKNAIIPEISQSRN
jgi:hypothetical protein